jgi:hypothetical protein
MLFSTASALSHKTNNEKDDPSKYHFLRFPSFEAFQPSTIIFYCFATFTAAVEEKIANSLVVFAFISFCYHHLHIKYRNNVKK